RHSKADEPRRVVDAAAQLAYAFGTGVRIDVNPMTEDHVRMGALRLEAVIVDGAGFRQGNELGEAEIEYRAHVAAAEVVSHLGLGRKRRLRVPRLLLLRELRLG